MKARNGVLVTGADGSLGRVICDRLEKGGWQVWRQTRRAQQSSIVADLLDEKGFDLAARDLNPSAVIHLAAVFPGVPGAERLLDVNERMTSTLHNWMVKRDVSVCLFASTCAVYGESSKPCTEETDPAPSGWYASGKLEMEKAFAQGPWRHVSLRISAPYGPKPRVPTVINHFLGAAARGEPLSLWGSGGRAQHFVHVRDVALAFHKALQSDAVGVFNVSGPVPVTMNELAVACVRIAGSSSLIRHVGVDPQEHYRGCYPWDKAHSVFGYAPTVSLDAGLADTYHQMRRI